MITFTGALGRQTAMERLKVFDAEGRSVGAELKLGEEDFVNNLTWAGDGRRNPYKSELIRGFEIADGEEADLIRFLESLTDPGFLTNPSFSAP